MSPVEIRAAHRINAALLRQTREKMLWKKHCATNAD